jgi:molybdopterin-synthase adenylyltransferase
MTTAESPLADDELERYARHIVLREIGGAGQVALKAAHVTVIGAGGIGAPVLQYLAAAGVGQIVVIDDDRVDISNLQRQTLFGDLDVGEPKVAAAAKAIHRLNPGVTFSARYERITESNASSLLCTRGIPSVIIDGSDNFATRLAVADAAYALRIPLVSAAIGQFHGQLGTWRGWLAGQPCYRCYVGDAHDADDCDTCAELGVLGAMTGIMGSMAALEIIRTIVPFGESPLGKLHIFDGLAPSMRTIRIPKDPSCRTCGAQ